jgi:hypothetical protein
VKSAYIKENHFLVSDGFSMFSGKGSLKISFATIFMSPRNYVALYASIGSVSSSKDFIIRFSILWTTESGIVCVGLRTSVPAVNNLTKPQSKPSDSTKVDHESLIKAPVSDDNSNWVNAVSQGSGTTYIYNVEVFEASVTDLNIYDHVRLELSLIREVKTVKLGLTSQWLTVHIMQAVSPYKHFLQ